MELLQALQRKESLNSSDASTLLQFLQEHTAPVLSCRSPAGPTLPSGSQSNRQSGAEGHSARPLLHQKSKTRDRPQQRSAKEVQSDRRRVQLPASDRRSTSRPLPVDSDHSQPLHSHRYRGCHGDATADNQVSVGTSFNISSLDEFPPMRSDDSGTTSSKSKRKGKSPRTPRRITLTPLHDQTQSSVPQFADQSSPHSWKSNPVFTEPESQSLESPSCLSEERKLLQQERSKRGRKNPQKIFIHGGDSSDEATARLSSTGRKDVTKGASSSSSRRSRSPFKGQQNSRPVVAPGHQRLPDSKHRLHGDSLDSKISSHSIFELSRPHNQSASPIKAHPMEAALLVTTKRTPSVRNLSTRSAPEVKSATHLLGRLQDVSTALPLTSTPFPPLPGPVSSSPRQRQQQVSLSNVTNMEMLDSLADLYAKIIKDRLVPNITSEVYFTVQLLTSSSTLPHSSASSFSDGSAQLFTSTDNCVYFAVAVLSRIRHLLAALDRPTLQLLADNIWISEFLPELSVFFAKACSVVSTQQNSSSHCLFQEGMGAGVPFQENTDNSSNFPNLKAFYAFKKQRDAFYSVLREWEKSHDKPNWSVKDALAERIRSLVLQTTELCSHAHFSRLFQKQLVESCRNTWCVESVGNSSLVGELKKTDPSRLMRLNERFFQPSARHGPCPPPSFSQMEEFFSEFIVAADSYVFNLHLMSTLYFEIVKLDSSLGSIQSKDVPEVLQSLSVMAKFLGFIEFLPYKNPSPDTSLAARNLVQQFNVLQCVQEAMEKGTLSLTITWVVQYLSMMDSQAPSVKQYSTLLHTLVEVYRSVPFQPDDVIMTSRAWLLVTASLGWLFEIPNMPSSVFSEGSRQGLLPSNSIDNLDEDSVVTVEMLYSCCPFLGEIRLMLAEFAAGLQSRASPIKKIKPLSAEPDLSEIVPADRQLQMQLQDCFFRGHPTYLRQLCDITAERISAAAIAQCDSKFVAGHIARGLQELSVWMREQWSLDMSSVSDDYEPFIKVEGTRQLGVVLEGVAHAAVEDTGRFYPNEQCNSALQLLLSDTLNSHVVKTTVDITTDWANEKCNKWCMEKLRAVIREDLARGFDRLHKVLRSALKKDVSQLQLSLALESNMEEQSVKTTSSVPVLSPLPNPVKPTSGSSVIDVRRPFTADRPMSAIEELMVLARNILKVDDKAPERKQLLDLQTAIQCATLVIESATTLLPGTQIPLLTPVQVTDLSSISIDLAAHLVSFTLLNLPQSQAEDSELNLLQVFISFWKLLKNLKVEIPVERLLSGVAFDTYIQRQKEGIGVWRSLSSVLTSCVCCEITSSANMEALWLCRRQQLCPAKAGLLLTAACVFLDQWYTTTVVDVKGFSVTVNFPEVHFVRLLSTLLEEMDSGSIPSSVLTHAQLKTTVHPF